MNHHYYTAKFAFVFSGHLPLIKDISSIITTVGQQKLCKKTSLFLCQQQQRWKERQKPKWIHCLSFPNSSVSKWSLLKAF